MTWAAPRLGPRLGRRLGLRVRALIVTTLVIGLTLTAGAIGLVSALEGRLTDASDELARARIHDLLALAEADALPARLRQVGDDGVAQVVDADGRVLAASPNVAGRPAIARFDPGTVDAVRIVDAPDDAETETYRLWAATGPSGQSGPSGSSGSSGKGRVTVYLGSSIEAVSEASRAQRRALWVGVPLATLLLAAATWLVLGRVLGRVDRIRAEVDTISDDRLDTRVEGDGVPDEIGRLASTMNAMLARLETSARRQRDFVADVSHDLQSPLTAQRVALELTLRRPGEVDAERLRDEVLTATGQMERLVQDLLVLAAADDGQTVATTALDLDGLVLEEATRARAHARVAIDTSGVSAAPARAHAEDVRRVVRNLLDNAATHAAGRVRLVVDVAPGPEGETARLDVVDDGPGVPAGHSERIFDRFHRADRARSGGGTGLGLAIARTLAERSGGTLDLVEGDGGAHFVLVLPGAGAQG